MSNTLFITIPVSILPDIEGWYRVTIDNDLDTGAMFQKGKWNKRGITEWLKPISVERLEEVMGWVADEMERIGIDCYVKLTSSKFSRSTTIQEAINTLTK